MWIASSACCWRPQERLQTRFGADSIVFLSMVTPVMARCSSNSGNVSTNVKRQVHPVDQAGKYLDHWGATVDILARRRQLWRAEATEELDEDQTLVDMVPQGVPERQVVLPCPAMRPELRPPAPCVAHSGSLRRTVVLLERKWSCIPTTFVRIDNTCALKSTPDGVIRWY